MYYFHNFNQLKLKRILTSQQPHKRKKSAFMFFVYFEGPVGLKDPLAIFVRSRFVRRCRGPNEPLGELSQIKTYSPAFPL